METSPVQLDRPERRSSPRLPLTLPVILISEPAKGVALGRHHAFAEDLSPRGALVRTRLRLQPGDVVAFYEPTTGFAAKAMVLRGDELRLGLQFIDPSLPASLCGLPA